MSAVHSNNRARSAIAALLCAIAIGACIRSTDDIPQPGEGVFLTGVVVERDATSGEVVAVESARVNAVGLSISATTDQRGFFQLQRLPIGRLKVRIERRALGSKPALARSLDPLNALVDGQVIDLGEIELLPSGGLEGFVGESVANAAVPAPASGALVVGAQTTFKAIAGEDGNYLLSGLPEGAVDLVAFAPEHAPGRIAGVRVVAGVRTKVEDLVLDPSAAMSIDVQGTATLLGENDSSGISAEFLDERAPENPAARATTQASGAYALSLPTGVYRARFTKSGYVSVEIPGVAVLNEGVVGLVGVVLAAQGAGDLDGDGIPDNQDPDIDNDGCPNGQDQFPTDPFACKDTDQDNIPDELDADDDNDGLSDAEELSPASDGFITDPLSGDSDGDGVADLLDNCPTVPNPGQEDALPATRRGDACESSTPVTGPPVIDHLEPSEGKIGDIISIVGSSFMDGVPRFVQFGDGPLALPMSVSPTMILAAVPQGAATGTVTIYLPNGIARAPNAFTFRPAPEVADFAPRVARKSSIVAVVGKYFIPAGIEAFVNGIQAEILRDAMNQPIIEDYFRGRELQKLIRIRVPDTMMMSGTIRVSTNDGFGDSATPLIVAGGPTILEVRPSLVLEGESILINGAGFSTADTGGEVMVKFEGVTMPQPITFGTDTSLEVVVPTGAMTGYLFVVHPAGMPRSPDILTIGGAVSYVNRIAPSLAKEGEAIQLFGAGLIGATAVNFGAAQATPNASSTDTHLDLTVPVGAGAGLLEVVLPAGSIMTGVPFRKLVIDPASAAAAGAGLGYSTDGSQVYQVTLASQGYRYDSQTLMQLDQVMLQVQSAPDGFQVAPDGTWGVVSSSSENKTYVVSLPDYSPLFTCDAKQPSISDLGGLPSQAYRFDDRSERAYLSDPTTVTDNEDGILLIDRPALTCETIARAAEPMPGTSDFRGILSLSSSDLLVADAQRGIAVLSVDRNFLFGEFQGPFQGAGVPQIRLFWGPGNAYVIGAGPGLWKIDPTGSAAPALLDSGPASIPVQSADRRWLVVNGRLFDVEAGRYPRSGADFAATPVAWHPVRNELIAREAAGLNLLRAQIIEH